MSTELAEIKTLVLEVLQGVHRLEEKHAALTADVRSLQEDHCRLRDEAEELRQALREMPHHQSQGIADGHCQETTPDAQQYNQELYQEIRKSSFIDMDLVRRCVSEGGADPMHLPEGAARTALHLCIIKNHVEALSALLATPHDMDFTAKDKDGWTPLHNLAPRPPDVAKAMLTAILLRLSSHPNDRVDWSQKNGCGDDFVDNLAYFGNLSTLYPMVKDLPFYVSAAKPVVLTRRPKAEDWAKLSAGEQSDLKRP